MNKNTYMAIACTLLILAGGLYYFNKDEPLPPPQAAQEATSEFTANVTFNGSTVVEQKDGKKLWELTAETVQIDSKTPKIKLINFKGIVYREQGGQLDMVAREALYDPKTKDVTMEGDVKATSSDGGVFTAAQARWAGNDRRIYGSGGITVIRDDAVITGDQVESDANFEKVKVQGNARVIKGGAAR